MQKLLGVTLGGNSTNQPPQEWTLTYETLQRTPATDTPIAANRFSISVDGAQIAG